MTEHRNALRMRRLKEARVVFNGRKSLMSCIMRDATDFGAKLVIGEPYLVPDEFELQVAGSPTRPARKVWMSQNQMGIKYL